MFQNREQAARLLVDKLIKYKGEDLVVFAIPRGAVIMGKIIAEELSASLDVIVVKKIGAPNNPELAIGAVGPDDVVYWDINLCRALRVDSKQKKQLLKEKEDERREREKMLRKGSSYPRLLDKTVIVVDDGVATGSTSIAAGKFIKKNKAKKSILATPVIATDSLRKTRKYFDEVIYLGASSQFHAVGQFYEEFPQVSDAEVIEILRN